MIIIIEGKNRTEFCRPKSKNDIDKRRFYETRNMLYRAYANQFTRMRIREFGKEVDTEEVIVYPENCIHAYVNRGIIITVDKMLADIDENRILTEHPLNKRSWGILTSKTGKALWEYLPFILVGAVLLYAFAVNGFKM